MHSLKLAITTGDKDGIGCEIASKALQSFKRSKATYFVWLPDNISSSDLKRLRQNFNCHKVDSLYSALKIKTKAGDLVEIYSQQSPACWVEEAAQGCFKKQISAMATGPLSKTCAKEAGFKGLGHTDILKQVAGTKDVFMTFLGTKFHVLTITGHIPLVSVEKKITEKKLTKAIQLVRSKVLKNLPQINHSKPLAILGLNPHAGEQGLIGSFEDHRLKKWISIIKKSGVLCEGPLVPDAAFLKNNWSKYSFYICLYHDQGLIPFKMVHGQDSGVHLSLGLPFIRTSVDHGTAKDIFNQNQANPNSMREAIAWALRLAEST